MGISTGTAKALLVTLFTLGYLGMFKNGFGNGFFEQIDGLISAEKPKLPSSNLSLRVRWTGFLKLDRLLATILAFFSPIFDGQFPSLKVVGLHFYGQFIPTWMLMLVEGSRVGNAWKFVSFITVWGLLIENIAMGIALPTWCLLHLLTSTTILHSGGLARRQTTLLVHPLEVGIMPWSILIGCGVPSVMAFLTSPAIQKPMYLSQQFWILLRMIHPLLSAMAQLTLSAFVFNDSPELSDPKLRNRAVARSLRRIWTAARMVAVATHVGTFTLSLGSLIVPSMFTEHYQSMLHPRSLFRPDFFWEKTTKVNSIAAGSLTFLQWDEIVSCSSILVWSFAVNRNALAGETDTSSFLLVAIRTTLWVVMGGPAAAAISLIEERDEYMLEMREAGGRQSGSETAREGVSMRSRNAKDGALEEPKESRTVESE